MSGISEIHGKTLFLHVGATEGGCLDVGAIQLQGFTLLPDKEVQALKDAAKPENTAWAVVTLVIDYYRLAEGLRKAADPHGKWGMSQKVHWDKVAQFREAMDNTLKSIKALDYGTYERLVRE
ncbi:hypothetical protein DLP05_090 [Stenotrophomonas phage vB_SmaS_DLP_5]|uniref:Uncharacterized protein n=1 Tax=Stenotrophomonas phage vB_SmaS_DLP_5 TaxID=2044561 RepID=A0A2D2W2K7_9CAUD|nr:hypothetical protein FDJ07_gp131 [Stenotrophomonas phage vB_SmaS_DLP_5]ATS92363.1 hypothetical protein DLP05_090 [Stenotrophomonas phage vB_SmaS_DLP_5]